MVDAPPSSQVRFVEAIPALPVRDLDRSIAFYRDRLGFSVAFAEPGFCRLRRDAVEVHLWVADDESWRGRAGERPMVSGAESFIAGTASCRIRVEGVDELHRAVEPLGILHARGALKDTSWGTRELAVVDPDNNLVTFFEAIA